MRTTWSAGCGNAATGVPAASERLITQMRAWPLTLWSSIIELHVFAMQICEAAVGSRLA
jgi:hypothetical protein